jgi:hypothetical protein
MIFERSLNDMESSLYLGDIKVVDKLVGEFINTIATNTDINVAYRTINRYSEIFLGMNEAYRVIPDWNDKEHLDQDLAKRLNVTYVVFSVDVFRSAFGVFAREVLQLVKESDKNDYTDVMKLKTYMVSVLLGTAGTLYPNNKGWR